MGHSTLGLLDTLYKPAGWNVLVVAMCGKTLELGTHGRIVATPLAGIAQFERDLISEQVQSGLTAANAWGTKLGRHPGQRPVSDRYGPRALRAVADERSNRCIGREFHISKTTYEGIVKRARASV